MQLLVVRHLMQHPQFTIVIVLVINEKGPLVVDTSDPKHRKSIVRNTSIPQKQNKFHQTSMMCVISTQKRKT